MKKYYPLAFLALALPSIALAQFSGASNLGDLIKIFTDLAGKLIVLLVTLALVVFFYRIVISIYKVGDDPTAVKNGKTLLFWGIIALFVMVSVWGIVNFLGQAVGINNGKGAIIPQLEARNK